MMDGMISQIMKLGRLFRIDMNRIFQILMVIIRIIMHGMIAWMKN